MSKRRYYVGPAIGSAGYLIYDHYYPVQYDVCKLPDSHGHLVPLRFATRRAAEDWVQRMGCDNRSPAQEWREMEEQRERVRNA